jgi:hypothetical protein
MSEGELKKRIRDLSVEWHSHKLIMPDIPLRGLVDEAAKDLWEKFRTEDPMTMSKALVYWFGEPEPMTS